MYYYDAATKLFKLSPYRVDQTANGAIMITLKPLYHSPANESFAYVMWNDAPPGDYTPSSSYAHSKGILATDGVQGFFMTHSMPNWPEAPDCAGENPDCTGTSPGVFPDSKYAQSMACVTLSAGMVNQVANTLRINYPWVYTKNMPTVLQTQQQYMKDLQNKVKISSTNETASNAIYTLAGVQYTQFAKSKNWGEDLWDDLVAPFYASPMYVETWISGSGGPMSSICAVNSTFPNKKATESFDIYQVSAVDMPDGNDWANTQDHSKWGVAKNSEIGSSKVFNTSQVCIGDINRMCSQEKRGGGALCTQDPGLLHAFIDIIAGVEACYSKDPCAATTGSMCYWCPLPSPTATPSASTGATNSSKNGFLGLDLNNPKVFIGVIAGAAFLLFLFIYFVMRFKRGFKPKSQKLADQGHIDARNDLNPGQKTHVENPMSFADSQPIKD